MNGDRVLMLLMLLLACWQAHHLGGWPLVGLVAYADFKLEGLKR